MENLNRRNTETVEQVLKEMDKRLIEQQIKADKQQIALADMAERMRALEKMVVGIKATTFGHGPSVK